LYIYIQIRYIYIYLKLSVENMQRCKVARKRFPRFSLESEKLSKVPRGHLVGPGIYTHTHIHLSLPLPLHYSQPLVHCARESGRKASEQGGTEGKGAERGRRVSAYVYLLLLLLHMVQRCKRHPVTG